MAPEVQTQLIRTGLIEVVGRGNIYMSTEYIGQAGTLAWADAERWLAAYSALQSEQDGTDPFESGSEMEMIVN